MAAFRSAVAKLEHVVPFRSFRPSSTLTSFLPEICRLVTVAVGVFVVIIENCTLEIFAATYVAVATIIRSQLNCNLVQHLDIGKGSLSSPHQFCRLLPEVLIGYHCAGALLQATERNEMSRVLCFY